MPARFTRVREDFTCEHCGAQVRGDGYTNHCPLCLWSKHVDVRPGDRAARCGALMEPVAAASVAGGTVVIQRFTGCAHVWRNRTADNDRDEALFPLFGRPIVEREPGAARARRAWRRSG